MYGRDGAGINPLYGRDGAGINLAPTNPPPPAPSRPLLARIPGETGGANLIGDRQDHGPPVPPLHYIAIRTGRPGNQPTVRAGRRGNQPRPHQPTPARAVSPLIGPHPGR
ncbi:MAG: hypothetical protein R6X32_06930, partial [Chloroflexota bacterium]